MAKIPGVTAPASENIPKENGTDIVHDENQKKKEGHEDQPQFEMDI